jgi:hypothetical protein
MREIASIVLRIVIASEKEAILRQPPVFRPQQRTAAN